MVTTIYLLKKSGEPRIYTNTTGFSKELKEKLVSEGFKFYRIEVELDDDDVPIIRHSVV